MAVQKTIKVPEYLDLVALLGVKDKNLDAIKKDTSIKISVNGDNKVYLFGDEVEVDRIIQIFDKMMEYLSEEKKLSLQDVEFIIEQSKSHNEVEDRDEAIILKYGKKQWRVRTKGQLEYLRSMRQNDITICVAPAGASKTFTAVCFAIQCLIDKHCDIDRIIITRPMVSAKGENDLGALPGELEDKMSIFTLPLMDVFERVLGPEKLQNYMERGKIKMLPLGYMRGISLENTICLCDEFQGTNPILAKLAVTRLGENSKVIIFGDPVQQDSQGVSGLTYLANALDGIKRIGVVRMGDSDIVRHPLIPKMLKAFEKYDEQNG